MTALFFVTTSPHRIRINGAITHRERDRLNRVLERVALDDRCVVELVEVREVDVEGLSAIFALLRRARQDNVPLKLYCSPEGAAAEYLRRLGVPFSPPDGG